MQTVAVIIGVSASNGLGAAIARRFAQGGLHTVVAGRTPERLDQVVQEITAAGGSASACETDATDAEALAALMQHASAQGQVVNVTFNVGNNMLRSFDDLTAEKFEQFWRICCFAGFLSSKAALPVLEPQGGSLVFTGASASLRGKPGFAHFSAAKGALRNMAQALAREYGPRGIHVGHVVVDGAINGERLREHLSEWLDKLGEDGSLDPDAIAESFWFMHQQPRNAWTFELDVRPFKEHW